MNGSATKPLLLLLGDSSEAVVIRVATGVFVQTSRG